MAGTLPDNASEDEKAEHGKLAARLKRFNSPADAAKALREQDKLISSGQLKKPLPAKATEAQIKEWRAENGIPETPDKYDLTMPDGLVFGDDDKPVIDSLVKDLHGVNASNEVVKGALKAYANIKAAQIEALTQRNTDAKKAVEDELRAEWGEDYRSNIDAVGSMLGHAGDSVAQALFTARDANGVMMLHNPAVSRWLAAHARELGFVAGTIVPAGGDLGASMDDEIAKIEKSMHDENGRKSDAYWKNDKAQKRYSDLLEARERRAK
jgi:hypothetical protein